METAIQAISNQQEASWNKFSPGWKKWDLEILSFMQPMADQIISFIKPTGSETILDIAAGTGEPGLSIATMVKAGKVIITDLADHMLDIAREKASTRGITNVAFQTCDVTELPFADNSFDAVSCRMGFMFFPDMLLAAKEIRRVLKPAGRFATAVWDTADKNFWVTAMSGPINRNMELPAPPPEAPGMFRCAMPGLMTELFQQAGFKHISEKAVTGKLKCDTVDEYWNMMTEIAAPFASALGKADDTMKSKIKKEVCEAVAQKYPGGEIIIDGGSLVIYGEK